MAYIIIIIVALILSFLIILFLRERAKDINDNRISKLGYSPEELVWMGKYIAGHPDLDNSKNNIFLLPKEHELHLVDDFTKLLAKLENKNIKNIIVEDQTSIEKRVSAGRLLTVGLLAFAWQKKEKKELAYLIIEWNDGRFNHETLFEFEGFNAMQNSNKARNSIIRYIS